MEKKKSYNWKGKSILVVEDDHINFNYLDSLLKPTKAIIMHAVRGEEAVELCKNFSFISVVLMDIRLPGIDGLEATRQICSLRNNLAVIAQTAYALEIDKKAAFEAGCCDFIAKPIRANEMLEIIRKYMDS
jgi:two-component system cell cycle response regulator DivK